MPDEPFYRDVDCVSPAATPSLPVIAVRPEGLDDALAALPDAAAFLRAGGFDGSAGQVRLIPGADGLAGAMLGLGADRSPWTHAALPLALPEATSWHFAPGDFDPESAALGFMLGAYRYRRLRQPKRRPAQLAADMATPAALATARAVWLARDLINTPANLLGPAELADAVAAVATQFGATPHRVEGDALAAAYPTIAAVGRGSVRDPVVASFTWQGSAAAPQSPLVSLCGKGVCFDSGGYDLKPASAMLRMKKDMGGAALMLGLAAAIMALDLPVRLAVRVGCVENMVSGDAMRPLDVLRTRRGLTVEIGNTDAEGRLVLCDLLAEASDEKPELLIDAATLTGAARVALGPDIPALFTPDDETARRLEAISWSAHDPVWRLPLYSGYDTWLSSPIADLNNVASNAHSGAVIAAMFLQRFVANGVRWVHLDTYAWNDHERPGRPEGGDAQSLRALLAYVLEINPL